jgi:hypothetical protein
VPLREIVLRLAGKSRSSIARGVTTKLRDLLYSAGRRQIWRRFFQNLGKRIKLT